MMFIKVDFPDPEGPMIATYSLRAMPKETPRRAWTSDRVHVIDLLDGTKLERHRLIPSLRRRP